MRYLSEWLEAIPENVVINKVLTGCGATTLAIDQERDTIIAVPYTSLIINKTNQEKHKDVLLGLFGITPDNFMSEISTYLASHQKLKIMTTYDSLPKVCSSLCRLGHNPYDTVHLVVDE